MTAIPGISHETAFVNSLSSCPHLGIQSDPETHVGVPDPRNCCKLFDPLAEVKLAHQQIYCLTGSFSNCEVYKHLGELPWPADIFAVEMDDRPPAVWSRLPISWSRKNADLHRSKLWLFIAFTLLISILLVGAWSAYRSARASHIDSEQLAKNAFMGSFATAIQEIQVAADDWGTGIAQAAKPTATRMPIKTAAMIPPAALALPSPSPILATPTPVESSTVCQDAASIDFEILSGPYFDPKVGGMSRWNKVPPVALAEWRVKNTGRCGWTDLFLWSTSTNQVVTPVIKRGDQILDLNNLSSSPIALPGEEITIALEFRVDKDSNFSVNDEWYLVVDGISLPEQPKFTIKAVNWIIILKPQSTVIPPASGKSGGKAPTAGPPPSRPTP